MSAPQRATLAEALGREVRTFIANTLLFNQKIAAQVGLNGTDMQCLHLLALQGSATPGELARRCGLTTGGITVVLDRLEDAGYVRRIPNPSDRRSWIIRPVAARIRQLETMYRSKSQLLFNLLASYDEDELRLILGFFEKANLADPL
jgi:DNA-binding MarR family transcriptional regulator